MSMIIMGPSKGGTLISGTAALFVTPAHSTPAPALTLGQSLVQSRPDHEVDWS